MLYNLKTWRTKYYQCAPGENNIPKYILLDNDFEVLAFPDLFPYGGAGYHNAHESKAANQEILPTTFIKCRW